MRRPLRYFSTRMPLLCCTLLLLTCHSTPSIAIDISQATDLVKNQPCKEGQTVAEVLDHSVKRRSQRDLGWRTFQEEDHIDIERAVLITKGMELRYRWRVFTNGNINPENSRAEKLCYSEDD